MNVIIGSARSDEHGKISGGAAGDQTGKEVSTQSWYLHSKGWRVFRAINAAVAEAIAVCMEAACANNLIGYDQNQRNTLYNAAKLVGFDVRLIKTAVETDCSALIRVCLAFAGIMVADFNTSTEASALLKSGAFVELTDSKYTKKSDYLRRGDILVTKTKGHTAAVLSNGSKAGQAPIPEVQYALGGRILKNGMDGADVKELQTMLIELGYSCGSWGADGEFGDATELAVRKFQKEHGCEVDGEVGPETLDALVKALGGDAVTGRQVRIVGGQCYIRAAPNKTTGKILGVATEGSVYAYADVQTTDGWLLIVYNDAGAWVSGMYGRLVS